MLGSFPVSILVGSVLGFLSGLGTGGGSLLILWLTLALHIPQPQARAINLLFFLPAAVIACLFRWKQGHLDIKKVWPGILAGGLLSGIFTLLSYRWDIRLLKKLFGFLLVATGIRELFCRPKGKN